MHTIWQNLRFALRQWRKTPGLALVCVLTLALGIGANTAVFSVMNAVLLRSLPVAHPERVFYVYRDKMPDGASQSGSGASSLSYPVYQALRARGDLFSAVILYVPLSINKIAVRLGDSPEQAEAEMVSGNFFSGLGVEPARGRGFTPADEQEHTSVAVISYGYWTRRLHRDPSAVGETIFLKGVPFTIAGVAAQGFEGVEAGSSTDIWIPMQDRLELDAWGRMSDDGKTYLASPNWWCLKMLVRLAPGVSKAQALSRVQSTFQAAAYEGIGHPPAGEKPPVLSLPPAKNFPGYDEYYGQPLKTLMGMVALVLVIALSNVAMLLAARNAARQREFSLRLAIGATRGVIFRQLFLESVLLVAVGGALAWGFAGLATKALADWAQIETSLAPDNLVLLATLAVLALAAVLFGFAPLRTATAGGPDLVMRSAYSTSNTDREKSRTARVVLVLQMALCLVLLTAAGLLVRTLHHLETIPLGMDTEGLVVFGISPQHTQSNAKTIAFYNDLLAKLHALPGVRGASAMEQRIGSGWSNTSCCVKIDGVQVADGNFSGGYYNNTVGADYFHTLRVPILAGRDFTEADNASRPLEVIANKTFVDHYLQHRSAVGQHIQIDKYDITIIGVVADNKYTGIQETPSPTLWFAYMQQPQGLGGLHIELRVAGRDSLAILPMAQKVVASMDPSLPLLDPMTQQAQFEHSISQQALFARLAGFFGLIAVLLVATGLYGAMAYRVSRRTMEIGVRMALGAQRGQVVWMVLRESLLLAAAGVAIGIPLAIGVSRLLSTQLFGVTPYDTVTYLAATLGLAVVATGATLIPARRAAGVDPLRALRTE